MQLSHGITLQVMTGDVQALQAAVHRFRKLVSSSDTLLVLAAPHADALRVDAPAFYLAYWPYLVHETLYALLAIALGVMLQLGEPSASRVCTAARCVQHWLLTWATKALLCFGAEESGWAAAAELPDGEIRVPAGRCYNGSLACPRGTA